MKRNKAEFYGVSRSVCEASRLDAETFKYVRRIPEASMLTLRRVSRHANHERLSTISFIHSEMEQRFGAPTKRSAKAKAYQDVLSSYQFRVKYLYYDLQVLVQKIDCKWINEMMRQALTMLNMYDRTYPAARH
jgi:hypothetical protein